MNTTLSNIITGQTLEITHTTFATNNGQTMNHETNAWTVLEVNEEGTEATVRAGWGAEAILKKITSGHSLKTLTRFWNPARKVTINL